MLPFITIRVGCGRACEPLSHVPQAQRNNPSRNILFITHHFPPEINGTATRTIEIINKLLSLDPSLRIYVITPPPSRPYGEFPLTYKLIQKQIMHTGRVIIFRVWSFQPLTRNPPKLQRILNYIIFPVLATPVVLVLSAITNIVIGVTPPTSICLLNVFARFLNKKLITDVTDLWHEEATQLGYLKKRSLPILLSRGIESLSLKISRIITVASRTIAKFYENILKNRILFIFPTPITLSEYLIRKHRCITTNNTEDIVIYAGNFGKPQALHIALKAFAMLEQKKPGTAKLILIGGGEEKETLCKLVKKLNLRNIVEILPPVPRELLFKKIYPKATIGLAPLAFSKALIYAIPTKIYEYLACGLPFISYGKSYELKRLSLISKAGIHIDKEEPQKIANAIISILKNREYYSTNATQYVYKLNLYIVNILNSFLK